MNQKTDGLTPLDERAQQVRDAIVEQLSSPTEDQRAFVGRYFANAAPEDLVAHPAGRLGAVALSHLEFAQQRQAETPLVRVFYLRFDDEEPDERHIAIEVVTDDMPFLVDSLVMELARQGGRVNLTIHPVLRVTRDAGGRITAIADKADTADGAHAESFIHLEIECEPVADQLAQLENGVRVALLDIRLSVQDWPKMLSKIGAIVQEIKSSAAPVSIQESEEAVVFMQWLIEENFVFLGYRQYDLLEQEGQDVLNLVPGSGLGILRETESTRRSSVLPEHVRGYARTPVLLTLTKGNARSTVHRPTNVDYVGVKRFDSDGNVIGEHRFLGLYTSAAYRCDPREIPVVRHKLQHVTSRSGLPLGGHSEKALQTILHDYPRDELFQIPQDLLYEFALGILHLQERQQIRVFVRMDPFRRFVSCLVFVPRERYNTQLRKRHQKLLQRAFKGTTAEFNTLLSESSLARVHFVIRTDPSEPQDADVPALEQRLIDAGRTWSEKMFTSLCKSGIAAHDANLLLERYGQAFPAGYREYFKSPDTAARDIGYLEALHEPNDLEMHLYRLEEDPPEIIRLKLFHLAEPLPLSDILPILENLGLRVVTERPFPIWRHDAEMAWIDDFKMTHTRGDDLDMDEIGERFHAGLTRIWCGEVESDGFNRLILVAGLTWRQTRVLRACCRYLMQLGVPFSQPYMENTLVNNWQICALLVDYFEARFDPAITDRETRMQECEDRILGMINDVSSLDDDRILRLFLSVMRASLRTNYFHKDADGNPKTVLTLKLSTEKIEAAPQPRPRFEIFVYSPRVEGVHLRGGKVARGGLRWSDRREDFRTEILGLMKAQMVKNAVIVPVGAKGGFVLKRATADREAWKAEGVACYQIFIQALLDITDNLVGGQTVCPADTVRHDEDDPYFVVAADKGTATFSDYANEIAIRNHFWLGDAFASGGSAGYDHKKMGITARGAWESVKRHFRELGIDTQSTPFRVVGIGDMAGDVFGNGMLLSRCIRLVAAFNHIHIFIDPEPDPEVGFNERQRLFDSPNLTWQDYDPQKISAGGGVFLRSAKRINLTPQIKAALDIDADVLTPNELIRCILKAPVDLLWNGGIGTFFKSRFQSHADAGDRVNDPIRIDGRELRCRVAGEGGNLGFTQLGRVEFAQHGGHMLTDAIDNSAGVDCSDHEVNIKILLNEIGKSTGMSEDERNALLEDMTEEVAALVLNNNYRQNQAISITHHHASQHLEAHSRFIRTLEKSGKLDRALEFLPSEEEVAERLSAGTGLTQPELAVLHSYAKITLYEELLQSDVCEDPYLSSELQRYFPKPIRERYASFLDQHPLRREIIATQLTNSIINAAGITMILRFAEQFNYSAPDVTRAYTTAREVFKTPDYRRQVDALDNKVPAELQVKMLIEAGRLIERATLWFLQNRPQPLDISATVEQFTAGAAEVAQTLLTLITPQHAEALERAVANYEEAGVPRDLAARCSGLGSLFSALDIVEVSRNRQLDVQQTAKTYFQLGHDLELYWLREQLHGLGNDYWQRMATEGLHSDLYRYQRLMTADVITGKSGADMYADWRGRYQREIGRVSSVIAELKDAPHLNLAMITVAFREIKALANASLTL